MVRQLVLGCKAWAADNDGEFPPGLESLVPEYLDALELLIWPAQSGGGRLPFVYRPGHTEAGDPETILIAAPEPMAGERVVG